MKKLHLPLDSRTLRSLRSGDCVLLSGELLVARDAAHARLAGLLERGETLPVSLQGETIYYMGPSPAPPGRVVGSCGPTTAGRMDRWTGPLLEGGVRVVIGKGSRSLEVRSALRRAGAIYCAALGGAGALAARRVQAARVLAFEDLGPEALMRLTVEGFPVWVVNDFLGGDLYEERQARLAPAAAGMLRERPMDTREPHERLERDPIPLPANDTPDEVVKYLRRCLEETDEKVVVYHRWCKRCGLCIDICPKKALARDKRDFTVLAFPDRCIQCAMCEIICPDLAVTCLGAKRKVASRRPSPADLQDTATP